MQSGVRRWIGAAVWTACGITTVALVAAITGLDVWMVPGSVGASVHVLGIHGVWFDPAARFVGGIF